MSTSFSSMWFFPRGWTVAFPGLCCLFSFQKPQEWWAWSMHRMDRAVVTNASFLDQRWCKRLKSKHNGVPYFVYNIIAYYSNPHSKMQKSISRMDWCCFLMFSPSRVSNFSAVSTRRFFFRIWKWSPCHGDPHKFWCFRFMVWIAHPIFVDVHEFHLVLFLI